MNSIENKVFGNSDLRKLILTYIIPKKCKYCRYRINSGNICVSCIWHVNNPKLFYILRTSR